MEPAKHSCVRMHRQARENLKYLKELSDSRVRGGRRHMINPGNKTLTGAAHAAGHHPWPVSLVISLKRWRQSLRRPWYRT